MTDAEREALLVQFVKDHLSPKEDERHLISRRYLQLQGFLADRTFQHGSYPRYTSTTPVNDLDVMYVLPEEVRKARAAVDPSQLDLNDIVGSLAEELKRCYGSSARIVPEPPSVGIYFGDHDEFSMDVVPVVPANHDMFWVPDVAHLSIATRRATYRSYGSGSRPGVNWIKSDPKGYIAHATDLDGATNGRFRKATKALKKWRLRCREHYDQFPLQSFHLELAVTRIVQEQPGATCLDRITRSFERLPSFLSGRQFHDRADPTRYVDEYITTLSETDRLALQTEFDLAQRQWQAVLAARTAADFQAGLATFFGVQMPIAIRPIVAPTRFFHGMVRANGREGSEQFLADLGIGIDLRHTVRIDARVTQQGFREFMLREKGSPLRKKAELYFCIRSTSVPKPYSVKWKVKNTGEEASRLGQLRGEIIDDDGQEQRHESTKYWGNHYVHCYIIKDGMCVAADRIDVLIGSA